MQLFDLQDSLSSLSCFQYLPPVEAMFHNLPKHSCTHEQTRKYTQIRGSGTSLVPTIDDLHYHRHPKRKALVNKHHCRHTRLPTLLLLSSATHPSLAQSVLLRLCCSKRINDMDTPSVSARNALGPMRSSSSNSRQQQCGYADSPFSLTRVISALCFA